MYWLACCAQSTCACLYLNNTGRIYLKDAHCCEAAWSPFSERLGQTNWVKSIFQAPSFHLIIMWNEKQPHHSISWSRYYACRETQLSLFKRTVWQPSCMSDGMAAGITLCVEQYVQVGCTLNGLCGCDKTHYRNSRGMIQNLYYQWLQRHSERLKYIQMTALVHIGGS